MEYDREFTFGRSNKHAIVFTCTIADQASQTIKERFCITFVVPLNFSETFLLKKFNEFFMFSHFSFIWKFINVSMFCVILLFVKLCASGVETVSAHCNIYR